MLSIKGEITARAVKLDDADFISTRIDREVVNRMSFSGGRLCGPASIFECHCLNFFRAEKYFRKIRERAVDMRVACKLNSRIWNRSGSVRMPRRNSHRRAQLSIVGARHAPQLSEFHVGISRNKKYVPAAATLGDKRGAHTLHNSNGAGNTDQLSYNFGRRGL
jgi:hypothetical protein